jgi:hypothetical protein
MTGRVQTGAYRGGGLRLKQLHTSCSTTPDTMVPCTAELREARYLSTGEYENNPSKYEDS